jgi:dihydroxyacetone kinase-like predicted kinase
VDTYGYCTEFLITGADAPIDAIREMFSALGDSLVVARAGGITRVHVHAADPGRALSAGLELGRLHDISVRNMDDQHEHAHSPAASTQGAPAGADPGEAIVLAFASGDGFAAVFASLGAVVRTVGDETGDAVERLVRDAVAGSHARAFLLVPGTPEVAEAASRITWGSRDVRVVAAPGPASAMAAIMAFTFDVSLDENVAEMNRASAAVQSVCLHDGEPAEAALRSAGVAMDTTPELVTLYYGAEATEEEARSVAQDLAHALGVPGCEVIYGGQRECRYLIGIE